jgi:hypothetical protein
MVSLRDFELLPVYGILILQMDFVFVVSGQSQVIFIEADGLLISVEEVQVLSPEFVWDLEMASSGNIFFGQSGSLSVWNVALDNGADPVSGFVRERVEFIFFHFNDTQDVIPFNGDLIRSTVFNDDLAVLVTVDSDKGRDPCQSRCSWTMDCRNIGFIRVCVPVELRGDDAGGHSRNGDLFGRSDCIHFLVGKFDLPYVDVVDQFVAVHEVDANDIVVQLVDDVHWMCEFLSLDIQVYFIDPE